MLSLSESIPSAECQQDIVLETALMWVVKLWEEINPIWKHLALLVISITVIRITHFLIKHSTMAHFTAFLYKKKLLLCMSEIWETCRVHFKVINVKSQVNKYIK